MKRSVPKPSFDDGAILMALVVLAVVVWLQTSSGQHLFSRNRGTSFETCASPRGVASDGPHIWVACRGANSIEEFNANDGRPFRTITDSVDLASPENLIFDGQNIWVSNSSVDRGMLTKVRAKDGVVLRTYAVGSGPYGMVFDGASVWVANYKSNDLSKVNVSTGRVTNDMRVEGCYMPNALGFDGSHIWVNCGRDKAVQELDLNGVLLRMVDVESHPYNFTFDGSNMWVVNVNGNSVTKITAIPTKSCPNPPCVVGTYSVGAHPQGVVFDRRYIWVSNLYENSITKLSASDGHFVETVTGLSSPGLMTFDGGNIWVTAGPANRVFKF
jgi:streptogramin lyase